jgi:hypothetical protein
METWFKEPITEKSSIINPYTRGKPYSIGVRLLAYKPGDLITTDSSQEARNMGILNPDIMMLRRYTC